ncbi:MAG: CHAP domain-containing protein [Candidatus Saccharibacteria bacterium]
MYQQTGLFFYKFRFAFASVLTVAFLILISAVVTAVGSGTVLASGTTATATPPEPDVDATSAITDGLYGIEHGLQHLTLSAGTGLYKTCESMTAMTVRTGRTTARGSAAMVHGIGSIYALEGRMIASSVRSTVHAPGTIAAAMSHKNVVGAIIQPGDDKPVPVISAETSAAAIANLNAAERQQIAAWQAAQAVANHDLGGTVVAGDPNHGGYPANWDNARQDSMLDSWGMYNRECVSYAAWKVYQTYGSMPYWGGVGNANEWVRDAQKAGIPTGTTPQVHSVAISMAGYYGHAMWVEKVSGNMIYVSQYNYDLHGHYSEMWVSASSLTYIYFK